MCQQSDDSVLDILVKLSKIASLIAIPIVIWTLGKNYQTADSAAQTKVADIKLAVDIVQNPNVADPSLYNWASKTLAQHAEVKLGEELVSAIAEGVAGLSSQSAADVWYAVVASLQTKESAESFVDDLKSIIPNELDALSFGIYKTSISKLYAVTLGGPSTKKDALETARLIRKLDLVPDAFAERDIDWLQVDDY